MIFECGFVCKFVETKQKTMKKEFKIFKSGVTETKVTILSKVGEEFNKEQKIKKYILLGYEVYDLNDNKITIN